MGYNRDKSFEPGDGIVLNDSVHLVGGDLPPSTLYPSPTAPAVFLQSNGALWFWNAGPWTQLSAAKNFSIHRLSDALTIQSGQHMISCFLEITSTGCLDLELDAALVITL